MAREDAEAVGAALAGSQPGYAALMANHREAVFRFVRSYVGDDGEALDVTQDCFIAAFAALRRYDPARPFRTWIMRIAVNKCHDWGRRRAASVSVLAPQRGWGRHEEAARRAAVCLVCRRHDPRADRQSTRLNSSP